MTGMAAWAGLVFFAIYFALAIAITRVRAELGTPHEIYFVNPQKIMMSVFGYQLLGPVNLAVISSMYWFNRGYRSHPMPNQLEAFKMAEGTQIRIKPLALAMMLAVIIGLLSAYFANLNVTYSAGGQAKAVGFKWWPGAETYDRLAQAMSNKPGPEWISIGYMLVGAAIVFVLGSMRAAFVSWPFHPAGYALAVSYAMDDFWFPVFLSWLIKLVIIRYGGMKLHNRFVPFFLGLILGDFFIGSLWAIIGSVAGTPMYQVFF